MITVGKGKQIAGDPDSMVLIVGFQAENTLGRRIVERRETLKVLGEEVPLKARVEVINALSAHADRAGLMEWLDEIKDNVRHAFAVHGEPEKVAEMARLMEEHGIPSATAPSPVLYLNILFKPAIVKTIRVYKRHVRGLT